MNAPTSPSPGGIFVCYRREDTGWQAGRLFDRLAEHFGNDQVFKDVDRIQLGDDFIEKITTALQSCAVLLVLIGGTWLTAADQQGCRRIDDHEDFVRLEIETALARSIPVIPILVGDTRSPGSATPEPA